MNEHTGRRGGERRDTQVVQPRSRAGDKHDLVSEQRRIKRRPFAFLLLRKRLQDPSDRIFLRMVGLLQRSMPFDQQTPVGTQRDRARTDLHASVTDRKPVGTEQILRNSQREMRHEVAVHLPQQRYPPRRAVRIGGQVDDAQPARLLRQHRDRQFHSRMRLRHRLPRVRRLGRDRRARPHLRRNRGGLGLEQHRQKHVAGCLQVIGKRLVEFFGIVIRLEEHHVEHDGLDPRLLQVPHDVSKPIARPWPTPERVETRFIDRE